MTAPWRKELDKVGRLGVIDGRREVIVVQNVNTVRLFDFRRTASAACSRLLSSRRSATGVGRNELLKRLKRTSARIWKDLSINEPKERERESTSLL